MADQANESHPRRLLATRSALERNREFFDQFFTRVAKTRFKIASDESVARKMSIVLGSCNAARCQLTANNHTLILAASSMASTAPEIQMSYLAPESASRPPVCRTLRYQPPSGWLDPDSAQIVGDLTTWLELSIASFIEWAAGRPA